ncbi:Peptidase M14, carboxypeptidase A precursor [Fulvivirga imtechensis AK7]|uniref:Peptidase M14, carboxypeptidase A n=1 Tax=Fulvivirga imtechensis AK7 TaxID=1237149 RepID=L8JQ97_9BACT|nr:M14 family metallopeptidase [Fulvivirga imtechensis]ELR71025.1 Peptidase M14, carboxypeptidase A precursor [Fulvivirga imtechensis AK7]
MKRPYLLFILLSLFTVVQAQTLQSPEEFLGYELGERFTRHHKVVEYFKHVAESQQNVQLQQYGETYEHRPLIMAILSSQENMARLEEIRISNLARTGLSDGQASVGDVALVWLSYNIHGNEASSIEASMKTIHTLLTDSKAKEWLKKTVVIIDPCVNPDGRDRYANFYNQYGNKNFNPDGDAMEHHEPWPGGRPNHYLFDLNRDWAWQTQKESASRSKVYHQWMPHVHVDFHEQFINNPYYFAPAAEPFHEVITPWQREFQTTIGKNHAKYFDAEGWLYFTKESFDLLYPSYGDTYPTYNGAIGMTYEQAGHGYAGLGVLTEYGDTLTLKDRVAHHFTTGISTVEITAQNAQKVVEEFARYFKQNINSPAATYKTYVVKGTNHADKIRSLASFLDKHHIQYGTTRISKPVKGYSYLSKSSTSVSVGANDLVISTYQPMSKLITALFEPVAKLSDTLTYDITAWSLPYAYGLDAYALTDKVDISGKYTVSPATTPKPESKNVYAYMLEYKSLQDVKFLAAVLKEGINARVARKPLQIEGKSFGRGSIVITRRTNERLGSEFDKKIAQLSKKYDRNVVPVSTGFAENGTDLGSADVARIETPKIAVLAGPQTSSLNFGEIWHFFEQQIDYPITNIGMDYFSSVDLDDYNVLIVPHGWYSVFNDDILAEINSWVRSGGKLIAIGSALNSFKDKKGYALKEFATEKEKKEEEKEPTIEEQLQTYAEQERDQLSSEIFGAIFKINLDNTHPLAYGYDKEYFTLKTNNLKFAFLEEGGNVGVIKGKTEPVSGFAGYKATERLENSLVFGVENKGRGQVIYMVDNPLFRAFWENGKLLFSNAVFMVGN